MIEPGFFTIVDMYNGPEQRLNFAPIFDAETNNNGQELKIGSAVVNVDNQQLMELGVLFLGLAVQNGRKGLDIDSGAELLAGFFEDDLPILLMNIRKLIRQMEEA